MASRKEQKEQARARRLAEEQARAETERRQRRIRTGIGVVAAFAAVAVVAVAIAAGGGSGTGAVIHPAPNGVKLPAPKITGLAAAARAAGCVMIDTPDSVARADQNRTHVNPGHTVKYATNPPSYGPHFPTPASDGEYRPGGTPATGYLVHALEHGRIEYEYRPGLAQADVKQLESLFNETDGTWAGGQLLLLFQNPTGMPYDVAAVAWGHVLGCRTFNSGVFDAFRAFRLAYTYKGPEMLGTGPE